VSRRARDEDWDRAVRTRVELIGSICEVCRRKGSRYNPFNPLGGYRRMSRNKGGSDTSDNCIILCQSCHSEIWQKRVKA
jgi:5-methylcytosine-specific restriction endonuclease McrA